jgi:hypothetical protein
MAPGPDIALLSLNFDSERVVAVAKVRLRRT